MQPHLVGCLASQGEGYRLLLKQGVSQRCHVTSNLNENGFVRIQRLCNGMIDLLIGAFQGSNGCLQCSRQESNVSQLSEATSRPTQHDTLLSNHACYTSLKLMDFTSLICFGSCLRNVSWAWQLP